MRKADGTPLSSVVWIEEDGKGNGWILRTNGSTPLSYHNTSAFHRHGREFARRGGLMEAQLGWNFTNWERRA